MRKIKFGLLLLVICAMLGLPVAGQADMVSNVLGWPYWLTKGTDNQILTGNTGGAPSWKSNLDPSALPNSGFTWEMGGTANFRPAPGENGLTLNANGSSELAYDGTKWARTFPQGWAVGVTPAETWQDIYSVVRIGAQAALSTVTAANSSPSYRMTTNAYRDASGSWKRITYGNAGMFEIGDNNFRFVQGGLDSANSAISWGYEFTLDNNNNLLIGAATVGTGSVRTLVMNSGATAGSPNGDPYFFADGSGHIHVVDADTTDTTISPHDAMMVPQIAAWYKDHPNAPPAAHFSFNAVTGERWAVNDGAIAYYTAHPEEARNESDIYVLVEDGQGIPWATHQAQVKAAVEAKRAAQRDSKVKELVGQGRTWVEDKDSAEGGRWQGGRSEEEAEAMVPAIEEYTTKAQPQWIKDRREARGKDKEK